MRKIFTIKFLKQGLLLTVLSLGGASKSYSFPQLQALQNQLQAAQQQASQANAALAQEQAAHQQNLQQFNQCQNEKASTQQQLANLQVILAQTQASHAAALAQADNTHKAALSQAHDIHVATLQQAHATHQEEIRQALEQANIAHNAALEQARAQHIQTLEQTNATHHQQLQQALEQAKAGHIQETQQQLEQLQSSHAAALESAKAEYEAKLTAAKNEHENSLAQHKAAAQLAAEQSGQAENIALKQEVARLKDLLANNPAVKEEIVSPDLSAELEKVKKEITEQPRITLINIDKLLEKIQAEKSSKTALDFNNFLIHAYEEAGFKGEDQKSEDLEKALQKITDHGFTGKVIEQQSLIDLQKQIIEVAEKGADHYNAIKNQGVIVADQSPNSILIFLNPASLNLIRPADWITLKDLLKYSSLEELLAIHYYLVKIAKIEPKTLSGEGRALEAYLLNLTDVILKYKAKRNLPALPRPGRINDATKAVDIIKTLKAYIEVDANFETQLVNDYQVEYANINQAAYINAHKAESPLLTLFSKDKGIIDNIARNTADLMLDYTKYATLEELKAIISYLAQLKIFTTGANDSKYLARSLQKITQQRIDGGINNRQPIPGSELITFENRVERFLK